MPISVLISTHTKDSYWLGFFTSICLCVCLFFHTISKNWCGLDHQTRCRNVPHLSLA